MPVKVHSIRIYVRKNRPWYPKYSHKTPNQLKVRKKVEVMWLKFAALRSDLLTLVSNISHICSESTWQTLDSRIYCVCRLGKGNESMHEFLLGVCWGVIATLALIYVINYLLWWCIFYLTNSVKCGTIRHNEKGTSGSQDRALNECLEHRMPLLVPPSISVNKEGKSKDVLIG